MPESKPIPVSSGEHPRDAALDLTRASLTLLVIAHHAVLAYHQYAPPAGKFDAAMAWGAFPVVDAARGVGLDAFTIFNDSFFMAMMFLLSGLFVAPSLARKGASRFVRDRAMRLGLAFIVSAAVLAPLAYWPAYLQRAEATGFSGFWEAWLALGVWPAGPAWFLWVLLAFSLVAAFWQAALPRSWGVLAAAGNWCRQSPVRACVVLSIAAILIYLPTLKWMSPFSWFTWGPFSVQTGRIGLYAVYFFLGCSLGAGGRGISEAWMQPSGALARHMVRWQVAAGVGFVGFMAALIVWVMGLGKPNPSAIAGIAGTVLFALSGALTTFAVLAYFARKGHRGGPIVTSLARNAFGMYLVHYAIVIWTQYALLGVGLPGLVKAALVTGFGIGASWMVAAVLRQVPGLKRIL